MAGFETSTMLNVAAAHLRSGKHADAESLCRQVIQQNPDNWQAMYLLGRIVAADRQYDKAVGCFERVLALIPPSPELLLELGSTLYLAGRPVEAVPYLRDSVDKLGTYEAFRELGFALAAIGDHADAERFLLDALRMKPGCSASTVKLGEVLSMQGKSGAVIELYEKLIERDPDNPHSYAALIEYYLKQGEPVAALAVCDRCLNIKPAYNRALAYKCIALSEAGDEGGLHYLFDPDRYIQRIAAECPSSFGNIEDFNAYLAEYILARVQMKKDAPEYSTVNGWHSAFGGLFDNNPSLGKKMDEMNRKALDEYIVRMPDDPDHPAVRSRPSETRLISWAVVMDHLGHEKTHIHPKMWIGGVYYVQLPGDFDAQPVKDAGHIVFGQGPEEFHPLRKPSTVTLKPVEGDFVIFPGYFWHLTVPLQSREKRICVAHDLQSTKDWGA